MANRTIRLVHNTNIPVPTTGSEHDTAVLETGLNHRYLIEVDCSLGEFKSTKLKEEVYTINAPSFCTTFRYLWC